MVPSQFVFQKAGTARAFVTGTVLCTVNRHRGEPGHTHGTHGRTRAHGSGIIQTNFTTIQTHDPRTHPHDHPNPRTHPHDPQYRVPVRLPLCVFLQYRYTGNASRGGAARRALECAITLLRMPPWRTATAMHSAMRPRRSRRLLEGVAKHQGARLGIFGIMLTSSSQWVIRPWLYRHIAIFERLAILDGSEVGSPEAAWTAAQCKLYENCVYANEENVLIDGAKTDQTARDAATRVLLGGAKGQVLEGRWIYIAHPDEFIVQDPRTLVSHVERIDPFANVIEFQIIYSVPTLTERLGIREFQATPNGYQRFEPIISLAFCDAKYVWHEARLFRWETGVSWGQRHALTIPQSAPKQGWKFWPKEAHLRRAAQVAVLPHSSCTSRFTTSPLAPSKRHSRSSKADHGSSLTGVVFTQALAIILGSKVGSRSTGMSRQRIRYLSSIIELTITLQQCNPSCELAARTPSSSHDAALNGSRWPDSLPQTQAAPSWQLSPDANCIFYSRSNCNFL